MKNKILKTFAVLTAIAMLSGCSNTNTSSDTATSGTTTTTTVESTENSAVPDGTSGTDQPTDGSSDNLLSTIHEAVKSDFGGDYLPNIAVDEGSLSDRYGVTTDMYEDFIAEIPMISTNVDTFIGVYCKEGQEENVEAALEQYRDTIINDSMQYPFNIPKVQATEVERYGRYVFLISLGVIPDELGEDEDAAYEYASTQNERAKDIIEQYVGESE